MKLEEILTEGKKKDASKLSFKELMTFATGHENRKENHGLSYVKAQFGKSMPGGMTDNAGSTVYHYFILGKNTKAEDKDRQYVIDQLRLVQEKDGTITGGDDPWRGIVLSNLSKEDGEKVLKALEGSTFSDFMSKGLTYKKFVKSIYDKAGVKM